MFSPKVLDRASTFEFRVETGDLSADARKPKPCSAGDAELVRGLLSVSQDDQWHLNNQANFHLDLVRHLQDLHALLSTFNLEFGHRSYYESLRFASLAFNAGLSDLQSVLDRIVMQKILPRLHGSRRRLETPLLALAHFVRDLPENRVTEDKLAILNPEDSTAVSAKLPDSHLKICRMLTSLRSNQFASFAE